MPDNDPHPASSSRSRSRKQRLCGGALIVLIVASLAGWQLSAPSGTRLFQDGWDALAREDLPRVQANAEQLRRSPGFEAHGRLLAGAARVRLGQHREALEDLRAALAHPDTKVRAQLLAAESLLALRQYSNAVDVLRDVLSAEPENADAHRWAGAAYYDLGAMELAIQHLEKRSQLVPTDPRPHRVMGLIYGDLEDFKLAALAYEESLRRGRQQPDQAQIETEFATVCIQLNRHANALAVLERTPDTADVLALRAECQQSLGHPELARVLLQQSAQFPEPSQRGLMVQASLSMEANKPREAIRPLLQAVALAPSDIAARFKLSQAYAQCGDQARADEQLERFNEIKVIRAEFASVYKGVLQAPRDAESRFRLGMLADKLQRPDLARMWYLATLSIAPEHAPARSALERQK